MANTNPNIQAMMNKIARDLMIQGLTVSAQGYVNGVANVQVTDGGNTLWISYAAAVFNPSQVGGIDGTVSPFLGIGTANPGQLTLQNSAGTTVPTVIDSATAAQVLAALAGRANDIIICNNTTLGNPTPSTDTLAYIRGSSDLLGQGQ
jgi:hypothetical protein